MKIVDANVLLHAVNADAPQHDAARGWLQDALSGGAVVGFAWQPMLAFVRIATSSAVFARPLTSLQALGWIDDWLAQGPAREVHPTIRHAAIMADLLTKAGVGGNLVNDAHLAALAIEHKGTIVTFDYDFARFPGVRWEQPAAT